MKALLLLLALPLVARAEEPVPTPSRKADAGIQFVLDEQETQATKKEAKPELEDGFKPTLELRAIAGPTSSTYRLESESGHSVRLPGTLGTRIGLGATYSASAALAFELFLTRKSTEYDPLSGITTTPLEVTERQVELASKHFIGKGVYLRPAYRFQYREAREVSPVAVITSAVTHGLLLSLGVEVAAKGKWKVALWAGAYVPVYYLEKFQRTGDSTLRGGVEVQNRFQYKLGRSLFIGLAPKFSLLFHSYSGVGGRTVRDARERWLELSLPFEIGLEF